MLYELALHMAQGIGPINARNLLAYCGSAEAIFASKKQQLLKIPGIGLVSVNALLDFPLVEAENELNYVEKNNINILAINSDNYPIKLKNCEDAPLILFTKGKVDFANKPLISVVGTRKPSAYGVEVCNTLIADLAHLNPIIISGLALGIDTVAHKAALANNLQTIAVLGHGFTTLYPSQNKGLANEICANGALFTEFSSSTIPSFHNFPSRNRVVAGLADAVIVVESASKGGSLITADLALNYNRDVFAIPGRISDTSFQGCNELIHQNKAAIYISSTEFLKQMAWNTDELARKESVQASLFVDLSDEEKLIYNFLQANGKCALDKLSISLNYAVSKVNSLLMQLELQGQIRALPGKIFEAI